MGYLLYCIEDTKQGGFLMKVEFFHSVMCGHCFIMSNRIRRIVAKYPQIEVIHRPHPLRWDNSVDKQTYSSEEDFKQGTIKKWEIANRIDDNKRFNIEGLRNMDFKMPTARRSMIAIQAGVLAGGNEWDLFDRFQQALYEEVRNIDDEDVIADIIIEMGIDFTQFLSHYENPQTEEMIISEFKLVDKYDLTLIPAMVVERRHVIEGTKRSDLALKLLKEAAEIENLNLF